MGNGITPGEAIMIDRSYLEIVFSVIGGVFLAVLLLPDFARMLAALLNIHAFSTEAAFRAYRDTWNNHHLRYRG